MRVVPKSPGARAGILALSLALLYTGATAALAAPASSGSAANATVIGVQGSINHAGGGAALMVGPNGSERWRVEDAVSYHDVTRLNDSHYVAAYLGHDSRTGYREIAATNGSARVVNEWSFPVRTGLNSEVHDVEVLGSDRYLVADMDRERLLLVTNSTVEWTWHARSHYDAPADPTRTDWLHINDVDALGDGRYLVSVRNANQLLIIERGAGVVEVINEDGDPAVLNRQHNPQWLGDGRVLVADSENNRIVELARENGTWTVAWELHGAAGTPFDWPRDADRLPNGNTLITDSANGRVVEVTPGGEVVWATTGLALPYEADRVGVGERRGGPAAASGGGGVGWAPSDLALVDAVWNALAHAVALPRWVSSWHLAVWWGALVTALVGAGAHLWTVDDPRSRAGKGELSRTPEDTND
jgi:hypothetical protein